MRLGYGKGSVELEGDYDVVLPEEIPGVEDERKEIERALDSPA